MMNNLLVCSRLLVTDLAAIQRLTQLTQLSVPSLLHSNASTQPPASHQHLPTTLTLTQASWPASQFSQLRTASSSTTPPNRPRTPPSTPTKPNQPTTRVNQQITAPTVRVVFPSGENQVLDIRSALQAARDLGLDLVEVAANAQPPVTKILSFSKYLQQLRQQQQDIAKKHREQAKLESDTKGKEMRFTVKISDHDLETKLRKVEGFLADGYRTLLVVQFSHPKEEAAAAQALDYIVARLKSITPVETGPRQPARKAVTMTVKPGKA